MPDYASGGSNSSSWDASTPHSIPSPTSSDDSRYSNYVYQQEQTTSCQSPVSNSVSFGCCLLTCIFPSRPSNLSRRWTVRPNSLCGLFESMTTKGPAADDVGQHRSFNLVTELSNLLRGNNIGLHNSWLYASSFPLHITYTQICRRSIDHTVFVFVAT